MKRRGFLGLGALVLAPAAVAEPMKIADGVKMIAAIPGVVNCMERWDSTLYVATGRHVYSIDLDVLDP